MNVEKSLYAYLTSDGTNTSAIVSNRVYPVMIPANVTYPAIAYQRVGGGVDLAHDGGYQRTAQMQIVCGALGVTTETTANQVARAYGQAKELAQAVIKDLVGFKGELGAGGVKVTFSNLVNEVDTADLEDGVYVRCDFTIKYLEVI